MSCVINIFSLKTLVCVRSVFNKQMENIMFLMDIIPDRKMTIFENSPMKRVPSNCRITCAWVQKSALNKAVE